MEIIGKGGIIMVIILLLSVVATAIIIERFLFFRRIRVDEEKLINRLKSALQKHHYDEALDICENNPSPISNLMRVGIENRGFSQGTIKDAIMSAANLEIPNLERYLTSLGTIAHISPLLGLLGTVTGNIKAFGVLGSFGGATAAGIIVSVPTVAFYNFLVNKVNHIIIRLENRVNDLVFLLGKE